MTSTTLKKEFHDLIDKTDNTVLLEQFYRALVSRIDNSKHELWDSLTESEKNEVLIAFEESKNEKNLVSYDSVKEKHKKWLIK